MCFCISYRSICDQLTILEAAAGVEASVTKVEGASVSTQMADLEDHRMDLVGMVLQVADSGAADLEAAEGDSVHREVVVVGMEVGTVPISNGRAQGWTRIAIRNDQGIERVFGGVPPGSHHGVSLPECFSVYSLSLSLVASLSLPATCCVSIQCYLGYSTNG